jgi:hypothetical protein
MFDRDQIRTDPGGGAALHKIATAELCTKVDASALIFGEA